MAVAGRGRTCFVDVDQACHRGALDAGGVRGCPKQVALGQVDGRESLESQGGSHFSGQPKFLFPIRDVLAAVDLAGALKDERDHLIRGARGVGDAVEIHKQTFLAAELSLGVVALFLLAAGAVDGPPEEAPPGRRHHRAGGGGVECILPVAGVITLTATQGRVCWLVA